MLSKTYYTYPNHVKDNARSFDMLSYNEKLDPEHLQFQVQWSINALVNLRQKEYIQKARNIYNGVLDEAEFQYLEEYYGIANVCDMKFIPLVRKHIQILINSFMSQSINYTVSTKGEEILMKANDEKLKYLFGELITRTKQQIQRNLQYLEKVKTNPNTPPPKDLLAEEQLEELEKFASEKFITSFEISAQHVLNYLMQSRSVGFIEKLEAFVSDLFITGSGVYKGSILSIGEDPQLEIIDPKNFFYKKNVYNRYINSATRCVRMFQMTKQEILNKYGHMMTKADIEKLFSNITSYGYYSDDLDFRGSDFYNLRDSYSELNYVYNDTYYPEWTDLLNEVVTCYDVEWLANNEFTLEELGMENDAYSGLVEGGNKKITKRYRLDRYVGTRIGNDIFVGMGRDENTIRDIDRPYHTTISYNGLSITDRGGRPFSIALMGKDIQDKYNIYHYMRDNAVANSGVKGQWVALDQLPTFLGDTPEERLVKWKAYLKQGLGLLNTSQEGMEDMNKMLNTIFSGFDSTINYDTVRAWNEMIVMLEQTLSNITGVPREMLAQIEATDAVTNVQVGIKQGAILTKHFMNAGELGVQEMLNDMLNLSKVAYSKGKKGSYILGDERQQIFTIEPNKLTNASFDVHVVNGGKEAQEKQLVQQVGIEMAKGGLAKMDDLFKLVRASGLTQAIAIAEKSLADQKKENDQLGQAAQQIQQMEEQLKQLSTERDKLVTEIGKIEQEKIGIEKFKAETDRIYKQGQLRIKDKEVEADRESDKERTQAEILELYDGNKQNDEIVNTKR